MEWLEYCLETPLGTSEDLAARLTANGAAGLVIEDGEEFERFLEENRQFWDYVDQDLLDRLRGVSRVKFYVPNTPDGRREAEGYLAGVDAPRTVTPLAEEDWANNWKRYYQPLTIGDRLYVVPEWLPQEPPAGRVSLVLNPGLTFGTGSHPTTQLCLEGVERYTRAGDRVLDLGCGSGILSVAAMKLGAKTALGVDVDPKSGDVAYENAALNGVTAPAYQVLVGDVLSDAALRRELGREPWDLILANIVSDVIIPLSAWVGDLLAPGGHFLCSGIIDTRADEVETALREHGFAVLRRLERKGWVAFETERAL